MPNLLINESSPYLLQHANNPVNWYPWCDAAFEKARSENKLVLVSIGYSACHWCHVMEHESFENEEVAKQMNANFVCIKVDREERPDIDHLYMDAVQRMTGRGGWPLNCFVLPDKRPVYGGTYFPKEHWLKVLKSLADTYNNEPLKVTGFADEMEKTLRASSFAPSGNKKAKVSLNRAFIDDMVSSMKPAFDTLWGGYGNAPKFPMPAVNEFLLHYLYVLKATDNNDVAKSLSEYIFLTLDKMAMGGLYDVVGGGFSRYSTDTFWKVPHFEKMLYDNGQLMSLYAHAYQCNPNPLYKDVVYGISAFISRHLTSVDGGFYCALDADSQGKEGKYYVWTKEELTQLMGADFPLFADYFTIHEDSEWEDGQYILFRKEGDEAFCTRNKISLNKLETKKQGWLDALDKYRQKRVAPALDDKVLASWNGLMLKGFIDAYRAFGDTSFFGIIKRNADFICKKFIEQNHSMWRNYKSGKPSVSAFLDDYAMVASAFFELYEITFDEQWLYKTQAIVEYALAHFYDSAKNLFYYTANYHKSPILRKMETEDNVIPSSNSVMANVLFKLGHCMAKEMYMNIAESMLFALKDNMKAYPYGYANWARLALRICCPFYEVAITGPEAATYRDNVNKKYLPNKITVGTTGQSALELLKEKPFYDKTLVYICENKTCYAPVHSIDEAVSVIEHIK